MPRAGPTAAEIENPSGAELNEFVLVDIDLKVAQAVSEGRRRSFARTFPRRPRAADRIEIGDIVSLQIWEAAGGGLFTAGDTMQAAGTVSAQLPPQAVDSAGRISVPYVGAVNVAGRSVRDVEKDIQGKLTAKAIDPQVVVLINEKRGSVITVTGNVNRPGRIPLLTGKERLLDIISLAGGTSSPAYESFVRLTRGNVSESVLLSDVIANPRENIEVGSSDLIHVTAFPRTYMALGAALKPSEVPFAIERLSLGQAVARAGGLNDLIADPGGVYLFRFEDPSVVERIKPQELARFNGARKIPVIYKSDFRDPRSLFNIQAFEVLHGDLVYFANAESAQLQKFMTLIGSGVGIVRTTQSSVVTAQ
jgi:polysaccharide export outer membrane protein